MQGNHVVNKIDVALTLFFGLEGTLFGWLAKENTTTYTGNPEAFGGRNFETYPIAGGRGPTYFKTPHLCSTHLVYQFRSGSLQP